MLRRSTARVFSTSFLTDTAMYATASRSTHLLTNRTLHATQLSRPPLNPVGILHMYTGRHSFSSGKKTDFTTQVEEDKRLLEEASSLKQRFANFFITIPKDIQQQLEASNVHVSKIVWTDLKNPLLQKYHFDLQDFAVGVKDAFELIRTSAVHFENFLSKEDSVTPKDDESTQLLQQVLHPSFYTLYVVGFRELSPVDNAIVTMENIDIRKMTIERISVGLVDDDFYQKETDAFKNLALMLEKIILKAPWEKESRRKSLEMLHNIKFERRFPTGAVIANIEIRYESEEQLTITNQSNQSSADDKGKLSDVKRTVETQVLFQSCISGQVPMDWKIAMMEVLSSRVEEDHRHHQ